MPEENEQQQNSQTTEESTINTNQMAPDMAQESTVAPQAEQTDSTVFAKPPKKKPTVLIGALVFLVVLLIGAGGAAYAVWYQSPEKVVLDSVMNALKADTVKATSTVSIVTEDVSVELSPEILAGSSKYSVITAVKIKSEKAKYSMLDGVNVQMAAVVETSGDGYIKFSGLSEVYESAVKAYIAQTEESYREFGGKMTEENKKDFRQQMDDYVKPIIEKVEDQWIKSDASSNSETAKTQECLANAMKTLKKDENLAELGDVYEANRFIAIKQSLGSKDGSLGYRLGFDEQKSKSFAEAAKTTSTGKAFEECNDSSDAVDEQVDSDENNSIENKTTVDIWISRWSHEITKVDVTGVDNDNPEQTIDMTISPVFNEPVDIKTPENAKTVEEISKDLQLLQASGATPVAI